MIKSVRDENIVDKRVQDHHYVFQSMKDIKISLTNEFKITIACSTFESIKMYSLKCLIDVRKVGLLMWQHKRE